MILAPTRFLAPTRIVSGITQLLLLMVLLLWLSFTSVAVAAEPLLNINTANPEMLAEALPGIGPAKARAIVLYREQNGPFKTIDQLTEVKGIGTGTLEKIRPLIYVDLNDVLQSSAGWEGTSTAADSTQIGLERAARDAVRTALKFAQQYQLK